MKEFEFIDLIPRKKEEPGNNPLPPGTNPIDSANNKPPIKLVKAAYFESAEKNFTQSSTIFSNRLKSALSKEGYVFTENRAQASFRLKIEATTLYHGTENGLTICYADVTVSLYDVRSNRIVFQDELSQKGVAKTREAAGRKALEDAVPAIASKIPAWFEIIKN